MIHDDFAGGMDRRWVVGEIGAGAVRQRGDALDLSLPATDARRYHDAQITDYAAARRDFRYSPPLRLTITAQVNAPAGLRGTAGFGFWNHPFVPGERGLRVPQAVWFFFGSPPNNMALALDVPGHGWKAATFNAHRWQFYALLPAAPIGVLLMRVPALYRRLWPIGQRAIGVSEAALDTRLLYEAHTYTIEWRLQHALFYVDGTLVQRAAHGIPTRPLGFIAWVDNQYAIVTPQGRIGFGFVAVPQPQSLVLERVHIERL